MNEGDSRQNVLEAVLAQNVDWKDRAISDALAAKPV